MNYLLRNWLLNERKWFDEFVIVSSTKRQWCPRWRKKNLHKRSKDFLKKLFSEVSSENKNFDFLHDIICEQPRNKKFVTKLKFFFLAWHYLRKVPQRKAFFKRKFEFSSLVDLPRQVLNVNAPNWNALTCTC